MARKLPIGIQGFEKLRSDGFLYVDKTEYIVTVQDLHQIAKTDCECLHSAGCFRYLV